MNKKIIAIIVGALAVLAIVLISIFGAGIESGDDHKNVIRIEVLTPGITPTTYRDEDNTLVTTLIMNSGTTEYQIQWRIIPNDATNKQVTFSSNNTNYATVDAQGKVTFLQQESVQITIKSVDDSTKKAIVNFVFPSPSQSFLNVQISNDNVDIQLQTGAHLLHSYSNNQLVLLEGASYGFGLGDDLSISLPQQGTNATIDDNILTMGQREEFILTITKQVEDDEDIIKTVPVKVIPYVAVFNMGTQYANYMETMEDFQKPANEQTSEYLNKTVSPYLVGKDSEFYFNISLKRPLDAALTQSEVELVYTVKDQSNNAVDLSSIATLNGNNILFKNNAVDNVYTFTVAPKYNEIFNRIPLTYTIKVTNGVNVWTNDQMFAAFKDLNTTAINLHSSFVATARANQISVVTRNGVQENRLNNYTGLNDGNDALRENSGTIFGRYVPTTYTGINKVVVNGNYFSIDGSTLPIFNNEHGALPWAPDIASVQEGLFQLQDERSPENKDDQNYSEAVFNNLIIKGNSAKGPIYTEDDPEGDLDNEEVVKRLTDQGSGIPLLMTRGGRLDINNVVGKNSIFTFWSSRSKAELNLNYVKSYDIWGGAIYGYGTSKITLTNVEFTRLGGAAISYEDASYSDWLNPAYSEEYKQQIAQYTHEYLDLVLTFNENVVINNYLTGYEGWFVVNGFMSVVPNLKTEVNSTLGLAGKSMIKHNVTSAQSEDFNYILQITSSGEMDRPSSDLNEVDIQYTIRQMISKDPVTGERTYRSIVRKNGFKASHPSTSIGGGNYISALGDYSQLENYPALLAHDITKEWGYSLAVIADVLQNQNAFAALPGYAAIATSIGSAAQAIISNNPAMATDPKLALVIASNATLRQNIVQMLNGQDAVKQLIESNMTAMAPAAFMASIAIGSGQNQLQIVEIMPTYIEAVGRQLALFVEMFNA